MNIPINLNYSIAYFLSGFIFILGVIGTHLNWDVDQIIAFASKIEKVQLIFGFTIFIISFVLGIIFDSIRNVFADKIIKRISYAKLDKGKEAGKGKEINYDFFLTMNNKQHNEVTKDYYTFYVLNLDLVISFLLLIFFNILYPILTYSNTDQNTGQFISVIILLLLSTIILIRDTCKIYGSLVKYTNSANAK